MEKIFILIFIWHFIFFAEGSCDNFKNDVVLLIAPMIIVKYFRKKTYLKISWPEFTRTVRQSTDELRDQYEKSSAHFKRRVVARFKIS